MTRITATARRATLAGYIHALQAPSRRLPQPAVRPARVIAEESLDPMNIWERINVRRIRRGVALRCGSLLSREAAGIVDFSVFWKSGGSKTLWEAHQRQGNERRRVVHAGNTTEQPRAKSQIKTSSSAGTAK
ncbi:hypothetical protein BDR07DRAFT_1497956 [Suillus spraguei]|nr:hypothetical protein BDR07DRAFT_1497956 [Suillus spraguei]